MDLDLLIARRKGALEALVGPHSAKQLGEDLWEVHTKGALVEKSEVDQAKLLVPCTITTQDSDRERDIVITAGGDLSLHQQNPVVLLDHGRGWSQKYPSVARALDAEGNYSVTREPSRMRAVSRFSESVQDSYQTFALIQEGLLNGVSIGFRMTLAKYRDDHDPEEYRGWPGLLISKWQLDEYSHCPIGMNPYCLADKVGKGYLGSERLSEGVWKSLLPHMPALREMAAVPDLAGAKAPDTTPATAQTTNQPDATGGKPVSAANQTAPQAPTAPEAKAVDAAAQAQPPAAVTAPAPAPEAKAPAQPPATQPTPAQGKGMNETTGADGGYVVPDQDGGKGKGEDDDAEEDPTEGWRPGAKALAGCFAMLTAFRDFTLSANEQQEHPAVREALDGYAEQTEGMRSHACETFSREYPDYEGLSEEVDEDGEAKSVPSGKVKALMAVLVKGAGRQVIARPGDTPEIAALKAELAKATAERDAFREKAVKATDMLEQLQREVRKRNARK